MNFKPTDTMKALDAVFDQIFGYCQRPDPLSTPEESNDENGENEND